MFGWGEPSAAWTLALQPTGRLLERRLVEPAALDAVLAARAHRVWPLVALGGLLGLVSTSLASLGGSGDGRVHTVPSDERTVRLGVFDSGLPNVLEIESGDVLVYP